MNTKLFTWQLTKKGCQKKSDVNLPGKDMRIEKVNLFSACIKEDCQKEIVVS